MQAETAAHMSGALAAGPSVFEVECAGRLDGALHPGLRHLLLYLADFRPGLRPLAACCDELHLLLTTLLHYHYLHNYDGSFGECFYALRREGSGDKKTDKLDDKDKLATLLWLTAIPYIGLKLQQKLDTYRLQLADGVLFNNIERNTKRLICMLWGTANAILSWWRATALVRGRTTPALYLQQLHLTPDTVEATEPAAPLQLLAFSAQAWRAQRAASAPGAATLYVPPPPTYDSRAVSLAGECPLCHRRPPLSPTALAVSGYVFCFSCIMHHVQGAASQGGEARCPVTSLPVSLHHLVRIYSPQTS